VQNATSASRLNETFEKLGAEGRTALLPYFCGGFPDRDTFVRLLCSSEAAGADAVEVGIPFSDPVADGPAIAQASQVALQKGATPQNVLDAVREAGKSMRIPLIVMTYLNPVLRAGPERFAELLCRSGVSGLVVPDLPVDAGGELRETMSRSGIDLVPLVAPNTGAERMKAIGAQSRGFVYLVSVTGVTGRKLGQGFDPAPMVGALRECTDLPVCVGFGISTPREAAAAGRAADGVITGSALVRKIFENPGEETRAVAELLGAMRAALDSRRRAS
jgi:tryptophan synthase alpha chain